MNKYYNLLKSWCDRLISLQITELQDPNFHGGILCPACSLIHGRIGDAVYPFTFLYDKTREDKYLNAAKLVVEWSEKNVLRNNGGYFNDKTNSWMGITAFSMIALGDTLLYHSHCLDSDTKEQWGKIFTRFAEYVYDYFQRDSFHPVVNYYAAETHAMALAYILLGKEKYRERAYQVADYIKGHFTPEGILLGEGHATVAQRKQFSKCSDFADLGYNVEESLPSLVSFAHLMKDEAYLSFCAEKFAAHLEFMLPDGAWDNSWGSRANKWTYWGSRTSDGAQVGLVLLAQYDPVFAEAAQRNFELYETCSQNGYLYGGRMHIEAGEEPCVHHSFCHAKALCAMLDNNFIYQEKVSLPREKEYGVKSFPSIHVNLISKGDWRSTISDSDILLPYSGKGTTGGTVTMLWNNRIGPVFAATMATYIMAEPKNMQLSRHHDSMQNASLRISDGTYESVNDVNAAVSITEDDEKIHVQATGTLKDISLAGENTGYRLDYSFTAHTFTVKADAAKDCTLILPVICSSEDDVSVQDHCIRIFRNDWCITLRSDAIMHIRQSQGKRDFHVIAGFQTLPVYIELKASAAQYVTIETSPASSVS